MSSPPCRAQSHHAPGSFTRNMRTVWPRSTRPEATEIKNRSSPPTHRALGFHDNRNQEPMEVNDSRLFVDKPLRGARHQKRFHPGLPGERFRDGTAHEPVESVSLMGRQDGKIYFLLGNMSIEDLLDPLVRSLNFSDLNAQRTHVTLLAAGRQVSEPVPPSRDAARPRTPE